MRDVGAKVYHSCRTMRHRSSMRVLYFAPKICWPLNTGAKLRNYYLARELARSARVTYLGFAEDNGVGGEGEGKAGYGVIESARDFARSQQAPPRHSPLITEFERACERVVVVPRDRSYTPTKIVRGVVGRMPLPILNYTTQVMARELARLLNENDFDLVQVEGIHLIAYLPIIRTARSRPLIVCDWHNVESELMRQYSRHTPSIARGLYARATARQLAEIERRAMREFDAHIVVSEADRARLFEISAEARIYVVENGVDVSHYSDREAGQAYDKLISPLGGGLQVAQCEDNELHGACECRNRIIFVGAMDYHANVDGAVYFAREVWPRVREQKPKLVFTIIGRNPAPEVRALSNIPGVEVTGTVADVRPYYRQALAAVVPLRVGGGSRLKILESMAAGVPVISTSLGAEGLKVTDGENILLADGEDELCRAVINISESAGRRPGMAAAGRALVNQKYDWSILGAALFNNHLELVESRKESYKPGLNVEVSSPFKGWGKFQPGNALAGSFSQNILARARTADGNRQVIGQ